MDLASLLSNARTIAVVGCSPRPSQTSHRIAHYLLQAGYDVVPVNPHHEELLGRPCYADLNAIPDDVELDIVNVFRRPEHTPGVVEDVVARAERTGQRPAIWTQLGVHHPDAQATARAAEIPYLANRCIMVDHQMVR